MAANATVVIPFSASTQGKGIKIVATSTAGTAIHVTGTSATVLDQIWLYLYNGHTSDVLTTIEFGGVTVPDNNIILTVPFKSGLVLAVPGLFLLGNGSVGLTVAAFAATGNVITASGWVYRTTP